VVGDGTIRKAFYALSWETCTRWKSGAGVRATIGAAKEGNSSGAKGGRKVDTMKSEQKERKPSTVSSRTTRLGDADAWSWVEPSVWTERMLIALVIGVKGGRWYSLMDKVTSFPNLYASFKKVKRNGGKPGADHQTIEMFEKDLEKNIMNLRSQLIAGVYRPQKIRRVWIPKPGKRKEKRPLGIPTVRDRVVQGALRNVIEPIFEKDFAEQSYGFRPNRGCKTALRRVDDLLKQGSTWVLDADLQSYFDTLLHDRLLSMIGEKISDSKLIHLVEAYLKQEVMDSHKGWTPDRGTPQGAVISPLLSNIYLNPLDHLMAEKGYEMIRYADDFVILCQSKEECMKALTIIQGWSETTGLTLHPEKTQIVDSTQPGGFDFLGYNFSQGSRRWPSQKSLKKIKGTIRSKTKRTNGTSMESIIKDVNKTLKGWFSYFKHCHRFIFERLDRWIRVRLRSILRKRSKRKGRGRGRDHQRWPNAYFGKLGLYFLSAAWVNASQSVKR